MPPITTQDGKTYKNQLDYQMSQQPTSTTLTPNSLTSATPIVPAVPPTYTPPTLAPLPQTPNVALTGDEQGAIDQVSPYQQLIDQLSGQTSDLAQKSFRGKQAESTGLNAAQNLSQGLYDKQQGLDLKSQAIEAQRQQAIAEKTQAMSGKGITSEIVGRNSSINTEYNRQALTNTLAKLDNAVSYYASTGKVREAQQAVDQAVDAEFTPKLQALDTAQRNLASLLKSPSLTSAQQKQALNLQAQYTAQENAIKEAAQAKKDTGDARIKALTNNPDMPQQALDAISMAQSPEEVAGLVNYFGLSSLSQQDRFSQDLQTKKFAQDERQINQSQRNADRLFDEQVRQFDVGQTTKRIADASKALAVAKTIEAKTQAAQEQKEASLPLLDNKLTIIDGLLSNKTGLSSMVGSNAYSRLADPYTSLISSSKQDFAASVNQLVNQGVLDALLELKKQGGTLGALSEKEGTMLRESASKIGTWEIKRKDGKVVGYDTSEKSFIKELNTIKASTQRIKNAINESKGITATLSPEDTTEIDQLYGDVNPAQYF